MRCNARRTARNCAKRVTSSCRAGSASDDVTSASVQRKIACSAQKCRIELPVIDGDDHVTFADVGARGRRIRIDVDDEQLIIDHRQRDPGRKRGKAAVIRTLARCHDARMRILQLAHHRFQCQVHLGIAFRRNHRQPVFFAHRLPVDTVERRVVVAIGDDLPGALLDFETQLGSGKLRTQLMLQRPCGVLRQSRRRAAGGTRGHRRQRAGRGDNASANDKRRRTRATAHRKFSARSTFIGARRL